MKLVLLLALTTLLAGETGPADTSIPVTLSNDYFAADSRASHLREMLMAANVDLEATYTAMVQYCKAGTPAVDPKNQKRFICAPKP